jgi:hypothetical protein
MSLCALSVENRIQNSYVLSSSSPLHHQTTTNLCFPDSRRAELEDSKSEEQKALEAAAEKAGVDTKDVEKGRKEREEEEGKEKKK